MTFTGGFGQTTPRGPRESRVVLDPVEFARKRLGFDPDEPQAAMLRTKSKRAILNCTRQWGKSTVAAAKAVHRAFTVPKSTVIVASPGERQSGEWLRKAEEMVARLDIPVRTDRYNRLSLQFPNGSRIVGLPASEAKVRGFSAVSMLVIDEAARVEDELYRALRPMLSVGDGDLWLMSTPCGKRGFFYETWEHAGMDWMRVRVTAPECPRISKPFLEEQRSVMGLESFRQEHMCEFVGGGLGVFDRDIVESALDETVEGLDV
jgi:Terminase large subunit, T4likevirus-type, N-terminal